MVRPIHSEPADVSPKDVSAELFPRGPGLLDLDLLPPDQMQPVSSQCVRQLARRSLGLPLSSTPTAASRVCVNIILDVVVQRSVLVAFSCFVVVVIGSTNTGT